MHETVRMIGISRIKQRLLANRRATSTTNPQTQNYIFWQTQYSVLHSLIGSFEQ